MIYDNGIIAALIELDDKRHETDENVMARDKLLAYICRRNNYPLVRFTYDELRENRDNIHAFIAARIDARIDEIKEPIRRFNAIPHTEPPDDYFDFLF